MSFYTKIFTINKPICFLDTFNILRTIFYGGGAMAPLLAAKLYVSFRISYIIIKNKISKISLLDL